MNAANLDDFMALNDQIVGLIEARIPVGLDLGETREQAAATLEKVNTAVARQVSRGDSLANAVGGAAAPAAYRGVMQAGLRSGDLQQALDSSARLAESTEEARYRSRAAFFYPLLVCLLAVAGIVSFSLFVAPTVANLYAEFRIPESATLLTLDRLPHVIPYLVVTLFAIAGVAIIAWLFSRRRRPPAAQARVVWLGQLTGAAHTRFQQRCASFCDQMVALLEAGVPLAEGVPLAAEASGDATLAAGARAFASPAAPGQPPAIDSSAARCFPPFLRWALWNADQAIAQPQAFRMAAEVYRHSAARRAERTRIAIPVFACIVLGGGATLLYGLTLILPITEMMRALAQ